MKAFWSKTPVLKCRAVLALVFTGMSCIGVSQPSKWLSFGWGDKIGTLQYSYDGQRVLFINSNNIGVYDRDARLLRMYANSAGGISSACFSANGAEVYYGGKSSDGFWRIFRLNIASGAISLFALQEQYAPQFVRASRDGESLVYYRKGDTEATGRICSFSIVGGFVRKRFPGQSPVDFARGGEVIVGGGPKLYNLHGTLLASASLFGAFYVSNDQQWIFHAGDGFGCYSAYDLSQRWRVSQPTGVTDAPIYPTWNDQYLVVQGQSQTNGKKITVRFLNATNGALMPGSFDSHGEVGGYWPVPSTSDNSLMIQSNGGVVEEWNFASISSPIFEGLFAEGKAAGSGPLAPLLFGGHPAFWLKDRGEFVSEQNLVRSAESGTRLLTFPAGCVLGPSGEFYAELVPGAVEIKRSSDASLVTSTAVENGLDAGWALGGNLWVRYRPTNGNKLTVYSLNGTALTAVRTLSLTTGYPIVSIDHASTRIALSNPQRTLVYNLASGALLSNSLPPGRPSVAEGNRLVLVTADATNAWQSVYDISSTPVLLRKTIAGPVGVISGYCGAVSPDGKAYASIAWAAPDTHALPNQGSIIVTRASDGAVVKRIDNDLLANVSTAAISTDSKTLVWGANDGQLIATDIPLFVNGFSLNKTFFTGGQTAKGTVTLSRIAEVDTKVSIAYPAQLTGPLKVTVPAGSDTATFTIKGVPVLNDTPATLSASVSSAPLTATITVKAPVVRSLNPTTATVTGPTTIPVTLTLTGPAPAGFSVSCTSSQPAITVPPTVSFTEGATTAEVVLDVKKVSARKVVTVTIGVKKAVVTINP